MGGGGNEGESKSEEKIKDRTEGGTKKEKNEYEEESKTKGRRIDTKGRRKTKEEECK